MVLTEVRGYLKQHRRALLSDLANHFDMDPDAIRGLLQKWISKGKVRRLSGNSGCSTGCCKCDPATLEVYEWVDAE